MANLRRKIEPAGGPQLIHTDHGVGYRFSGLQPEAATRQSAMQRVADTSLGRSRIYVVPQA
jgi:hypothetical protein